MCSTVREIRESLEAFGRRFDIEAVDPAQLSQLMSDTTIIESIAVTIKSLASARISEMGTWKSSGHGSPADALSDQTGVSAGKAKETIERGRRLREQPDVADAALSGELSPTQASLVAEGVEANPTSKDRLLDTARHGRIGELKDEVAKAKAAAADLEARRTKIHQARSLRSWTDREGVWHMHAAGNPEDGAQVNAALNPIRQALFLKARAEGRRDGYEAYMFDSLLILGQIATGDSPHASFADLQSFGLFPQVDLSTPAARPASRSPAPPSASGPSGPPSASRTSAPPSASGPSAPPSPAADGGHRPAPDPATTSTLSLRPDPAAPIDSHPREGRLPLHFDPAPEPEPEPDPRARLPEKPKMRSGPPVKLIIRVDLSTLLRGAPLGDEVCELVGYGPIAVSAVESLLATGNRLITAVLTKAEEIVGVAHLRRSPNARQETGLEFLYPTCAVKGCGATARLERDHRIDWSKTHFTMFDLLDLLCHRHHAQKTQNHWALVEGRGKRAFVPPDDPRHPSHAPASTDHYPASTVA